MEAVFPAAAPAVIVPAIRVREATVFDGVRLQAVMARCSQGIDLAVTLINTPDFFVRARIYERAKVFLAEERGQIAGSAAVAVRDLTIGGIRRRVGYEFQVFTSPDHRRKGVAHRLRLAIESYLAWEQADLTTAIVAAGNTGSERLFGTAGFRPVAELDLCFLLTAARPRTPVTERVRPATVTDLPAVAGLLERTWASHDLSPRLTAADLDAILERTPGLDADALLVHEKRGEIVACAAVWAMDEVVRFQVDHVAPELRPAFPALRPGEHVRQWSLTLVGCREPGDLAVLLDHVNDLAVAHGKEQIAMMAERGDPLVRSLDGLPISQIPLRLHAKALRPGVLPSGDAPLFVDTLDL